MKRLLLLTVIFLTGCAVVPSGTWELADSETGVVVTDVQSRTVRADCLIEKNKIMIPREPGYNNCGGSSGFIAGACGGGNYNKLQAYKADLHQAKSERYEVYNICLLKSGLSEVWVPDSQP
jgi:hypothetical protein